MVHFTKHALDRFNERFPKLDIYRTYARSVLCGRNRKIRFLLRKWCKDHKEQWTGRFSGVYPRITNDKILFLVGRDESVITVLNFRHVNNTGLEDINIKFLDFIPPDPEKKLSCPFCRKPIRSPAGLVAHIKTVHNITGDRND